MTIRAHAAALCLFLLAHSPLASTQVAGYKPDDTLLASVSEEQALDELRQLLGLKAKVTGPQAESVADRELRFMYQPKRWRGTVQQPYWVERIQLLDDRIRLTLRYEKVVEIAFRDLPVVELVYFPSDFFERAITGVGWGGDQILRVFSGVEFEKEDLAYARKLVDAIYVLKRSADGAGVSHDKRFAEFAAKYRASLDKPSLPEDARRFRVQAEAAVRERRMADAAKLYGEALKIAPWWPEGRFNRSLVLAEVNRFGEAIAEMKRYLMLVPEAPNARAAQDKVYEWEAKVPRAR